MSAKYQLGPGGAGGGRSPGPGRLAGNMTNKLHRVLISCFVIVFGIFIMLIPMVKTISFSDVLSYVFVLIIVGIVFLPSILFCIATMIKNEMEYAIIPALFLMAAEYYFFHDYQTWIASDPNAAIGLIIMPFYLMFVLGVSYGVAFAVLKIRKHFNRGNR